MTKIGLLSDTHGHLDSKIFKHFSEVDEIWHAGDIGNIELIDELRKFKPLRAVYGNIDSNEIRQEIPKNLSFTIEEVKIAMTHIAGKPGKYVREARELIEKERPTLFVCGHSHILMVKNDPNFNMLWMNPGACGYKGFHQVKTLLRFNINKDRIEHLEVIELGKRI